MAKSLKDILAGVKSSKTEKMDLKDLQMSAANKDQADFIAKHSVEKHADRVGNDDDVYKGKTKKTDKYKFQKDEVYEAAMCNHTNEGVMCEVHGESACPSDNDKGKMEKAKGKKLLLDKKKVMDEGRIEDDAQRRAAKQLSAIASKSNVPVTKLKPGKKSYNELKRTGSMFGGARQFAAGLAKRNIEAGDSHTSVTKAKVGGKIKEEIEDVEEVVRIVDPVRKKLDPKHGEKGTFQGQMERMHMAKAAKDRRKLTHGSGVSGFNSRLDPKLDKETYKKRDQDTGSIRAVRKEEVEYIDEVLTGKDPASKWIHDFVHSDNPKFKGKSTKERQQMALGEYYSKKRGGKTKNEQADTAVRMPGQASATTGGTDLDTVRV